MLDSVCIEALNLSAVHGDYQFHMYLSLRPQQEALKLFIYFYMLQGLQFIDRTFGPIAVTFVEHTNT